MLASRSFGFAILAVAILSTDPVAGANDSLAVQRPSPDSVVAGASDSTRAALDNSALTAAFGQLRTGMPVRVLVPDARILEGPFLRTHDDLLLFDDAKDTQVAFEDIDAVWRQRRRASEAGLTSGLVLGMVGAISFFYAAATHGALLFAGDPPIGLAIAAGTIIGFGLGFGFGYGVGSLIAPGPVFWAQIYPFPPMAHDSWNSP